MDYICENCGNILKEIYMDGCGKCKENNFQVKFKESKNMGDLICLE